MHKEARWFGSHHVVHHLKGSQASSSSLDPVLALEDLHLQLAVCSFGGSSSCSVLCMQSQWQLVKTTFPTQYIQRISASGKCTGGRSPLHLEWRARTRLPVELIRTFADSTVHAILKS